MFEIHKSPNGVVSTCFHLQLASCSLEIITSRVHLSFHLVPIRCSICACFIIFLGSGSISLFSGSMPAWTISCFSSPRTLQQVKNKLYACHICSCHQIGLGAVLTRNHLNYTHEICCGSIQNFPWNQCNNLCCLVPVCLMPSLQYKTLPPKKKTGECILSSGSIQEGGSQTIWGYWMHHRIINLTINPNVWLFFDGGNHHPIF